MPAHRLDPLLRPRSMAVVGASARPGSQGNEVLRNLPEVSQHVVFAVSDARLSVLALEFADCIHEIEINPVRLMVDDRIGLDALVVRGQVDE